ncbi:hypothetical protein [Sporomusa sp.]|nr:hypothetical protein [Sporomusa sp.]HWR05459.1 hypothetical protein [Sporomusa sp.]
MKQGRSIVQLAQALERQRFTRRDYLSKAQTAAIKYAYMLSFAISTS